MLCSPRSNALKWLDLSNTGILLKAEPTYYLALNSNRALARLDLAGNKYFEHTLANLVALEFVTHLNLANVKLAPGAHTNLYLTELLCLPSLKVLDLQGAREVFATGYEAIAANGRLAENLAERTSLMCVKLDPEFAKDVRARLINTSSYAPGRPGFSILLGAAGAFLAQILEHDVAGDGQLSFARELDARSAMRMMSVNRKMAGALSEFEAALYEGSGDPSFDWDLACSDRDGQSETPDGDNSSNTTTRRADTTATVATTQTTTTTGTTTTTPTMTTTTTIDRRSDEPSNS